MSFVDEIRSLDPNNPGAWPLWVRSAAIALVFSLVLGVAIYMLVYKKRIPELKAAEQQVEEFKKEFESKQRKAANLEKYKAQLLEMEDEFGSMLRQLPGETEVPNLLVDISQTGLAAGLEEKLFQPTGEVRRNFYAELPIRMRLTGTYHELGEFVSGIAALPRIVTLHNLEIKDVSKEGVSELELELTAKTYRYLDETAGAG